MREGFPKSHRLRRRADFVRVQDGGQKVSAGPLMALVSPNPLGVTRLGITVSSKVGNAVVRVRIRRVVRELFRKAFARVPPGLDLVVVARASAREADTAALRRAFEGILLRLPPGVAR